MQSWTRKELRQEFLNNFSDDFLNIVPNLNVPKFKKMVKLHMEGKHNDTTYIWRMYVCMYVFSKYSQEFGYYELTKTES